MNGCFDYAPRRAPGPNGWQVANQVTRNVARILRAIPRPNIDFSNVGNLLRPLLPNSPNQPEPSTPSIGEFARAMSTPNNRASRNKKRNPNPNRKKNYRITNLNA